MGARACANSIASTADMVSIGNKRRALRVSTTTSPARAVQRESFTI